MVPGNTKSSKGLFRHVDLLSLKQGEVRWKAGLTRNFLFLLQKFLAINFSARIALFENIETR